MCKDMFLKCFSYSITYCVAKTYFVLAKRTIIVIQSSPKEPRDKTIQYVFTLFTNYLLNVEFNYFVINYINSWKLLLIYVDKYNLTRNKGCDLIKVRCKTGTHLQENGFHIFIKEEYSCSSLSIESLKSGSLLFSTRVKRLL